MMALQLFGISRLAQRKLGVVALACWVIIKCYPESSPSFFMEYSKPYVSSATSSAVAAGQQQQHGLSVVYPKWNDNNNVIIDGVTTTNSSWCQPPNSPKRGFYFVKTFKTGSSSSAAIHFRVSRRVGNRKFLDKDCKHDYEHGFSLRRKFQSNNSTDRNNGFIWTTVRNPKSRAISAYYYYVAGHARKNYTEQGMLTFLEKSKNIMALQLQHDPTPLKDKGNGIIVPVKPLKESVKNTYFRYENSTAMIRTNILEHYNFVAVAERSEESLVVLKFLLDLDDEDIVLLSESKAAGSWTWDWSAPGRVGCFAIPQKPKEFSPAVQSYLDNEFVQRNADTLLHEAAIESLDRTIDAIGRDVFESALKRHRELKALVLDQCGGNAVYPCSTTGQWQPEAKDSCYLRDMGCGHECVDRVLSNVSKE